MRAAAVLLAAIWAAACAARAGGPPAIAIDRSTCSRCGMLISERTYAAARQWADGRDEVFDDIGCLVAAVRQSPSADARYWFHDAATGEWIADAAPHFVASDALRTPMGGGIAAYRDRAAADAAAARLSGRVIADFAALTALERKRR